MGQYLPSNVNVTNGSPTVTLVGVDATLEVDTGDWFGVNGTGIVSYQVASTPTYAAGDTTVTLTTNYSGATDTGVNGVFQRDFTTGGLPIVARGDLEVASILGRLAQEVDTGLSSVHGGTF